MGLQLWTQPPLSLTRASLLAARAMRLDSVMVIDHFQNVFPSTIWDTDLTWVAAERPTPHEFFDYQVLLGSLASRAGRLRLGVGVTESVRRHPVPIAQAMMTLSHLTKRAPILGIGAGERMNIDPYGLDFTERVSRLEEALQVIRLCLSAHEPITFLGKHYRLDRATMDLRAPEGRVPQIWVAGHGPRMLGLTGRYGDGWYWGCRASAERGSGRGDYVRPTGGWLCQRRVQLLWRWQPGGCGRSGFQLRLGV